MPDRIWKAAEYTRLSRDDGDKAESNSICKQKGLVEVQRRTRVVYAYLYALIRK